MNRDQKAAAVAEIAQNIQESEAVFAVDYRGLSVPQAAELRSKLRDADARFQVVKNTLTLRAADLLPFKGGLMDGNPLTPDDITAIARLPSRDILYAQLVGVVAHPIAGL